MEDQFRITYDSSKEKAFIVHMPDKQIKFRRSDNGLYYINVDFVIKDNQVVKTSGKKVTFKQNMVQTLDENKKFYTDQQIERAKTARELYQALGTPSVRDFKNIIHMNMIKNNPVTLEDIKILENIFGPDIGALKRKTTQQKAETIINDYIEIPSELVTKHENVTLFMDTLFINGMPFLATISKHLCYCIIEHVPNQQSSTYRSVIDRIF